MTQTCKRRFSLTDLVCVIQYRGTLNEQEQDLASQLQQNAALLQKYQFAGDDFNKIVQAYANILKSIERVQYDISLLK